MEELVLSQYKEPLRETKKELGSGFGFMGTLAMNKDRTLLQCHICGEMHAHLAAHVVSKHKMRANEYREKYKIAFLTPLASDEVRKTLSDAWRKNTALHEQLRSLHTSKMRTKRRLARSLSANRRDKISLETDNKRGNCPDQVIEKIQKLYAELGHTPSPREYKNKYNGGYAAVVRHYGDWHTAMRTAGLTPRILTEEFTESRKKPRHSKEALIEMLKAFHRINERTPTWSDFTTKRDLPDGKTFLRQFLSLNHARMAAGIPIITKLREIDPVTNRYVWQYEETMDYSTLIETE